MYSCPAGTDWTEGHVPVCLRFLASNTLRPGTCSHLTADVLGPTHGGRNQPGVPSCPGAAPSRPMPVPQRHPRPSNVVHGLSPNQDTWSEGISVAQLMGPRRMCAYRKQHGSDQGHPIALLLHATQLTPGALITPSPCIRNSKVA